MLVPADKIENRHRGFALLHCRYHFGHGTRISQIVITIHKKEIFALCRLDSMPACIVGTPIFCQFD